MSWGQIKKAVNSDLSEPLNYLAWVNDLASYGKQGYVYNQISLVDEIIEKSNNVFFNGVATGVLLEGYADKVFTKLTGDTVGTFDGLTTMELVAEDATAMTVVANSATASNAIRNSATAITVLDNSNPVLVPLMTNATTPSGIATESTKSAVGFEGWKALDKDDATTWAAGSNVNEWVAYEFAENVWVYKIEAKGNNQQAPGTATGTPNAFKIQYFNNGNWQDAFSGNMVNDFNTQTFSTAFGSGKQTRWRFLAINSHSGTLVGLRRLQLYGK